VEPRFIIKTHTEALRPGNYSALIAKCTFPDKGAYPENVEKRLTQLFPSKKGKEVSSIARYTVLTSTSKNRGFGFLLDNMVWSWKGQVVNTVLHYLGKKDSDDSSAFSDLATIEDICYLRFFLETEGAIILKLAERFCKTGELSYKYLKDNIQDVFKEIYQEYIDIAPDFRTRIRIKETLRQMKAERYDETTLPHKIRPHLQALTDLRILSKEEKNGEIIFSPLRVGTTSSLAIIHSRLKSIQNMENMFLNYDYFPLIAEIYHLTPAPYSENQRDLLRDTISYGYNVMRNGITRMADIDALVEWSCIKMLSEHNVLVERRHIEDYFSRIRKEYPSRIQYHVDGKGRVAYLVINEPI
jgi:hypothetical protein